ncbi:hypothetical protein, partial [Helicobacter anatolicus]|uniref:hypothetical protein n=1 Tax=Helicobacter anatolicus TaxID=2905874 RepID=UPI001E38E140
MAFLLSSSLYGQNVNKSCSSSMSCTDIKDHIFFKFKSANTPENSNIDFVGYTVTFGKSINSATLKDSYFQSKSFNFPNKIMTVVLNSGKTFNLEASEAIFNGNLTVYNEDINSQTTFTGKFSHGMQGNIIIGFSDDIKSSYSVNSTLTFNGNKDNAIQGNIVVNSGSNIIIFDTSSMQKEPSSKSTDSNRIDGEIKVNGGSNAIIFGKTEGMASQSKPTNAITGAIIANGGTNKISMYGDNTIAGTITAGPNGNQGINYLYFSGEKTTIGNNEITDETKTITTSIIAYNKDNNNTDKQNFLKLESKTNEINLKDLSALADKQEGSRDKARNIISLDPTNSGTNTLRIVNITSTGGRNYIGKNILTS